MDKETLSHYGWIVILVLILSVLLALASPFGMFIAEGFKATYAGFEMVGSNALGIIIPGSQPDGGEENIFVVPDGGMYYVGVGNTKTGDYTGYVEKYGPGEQLPTTVNVGDIYIYEDYEYRYGIYWGPTSGMWGAHSQQTENWAVRVLSTAKNSYTEPLSSINGKPVTNFSYTWYKCNSLASAPKIPSCAITLHWAFSECSALTTAPEIPDGVWSVCGMFNYCTSLEVAPVFPNSIKNMQDTFAGCRKLKTYVGSTDADGDFSNYKLPLNLESLYNTFNASMLMTKAPYIPEKVTDARNTFYAPPNSPQLVGKIYIPCSLADSAIVNMYFSACPVEVVRYCTSTCTGCSNCHVDCGH